MQNGAWPRRSLPFQVLAAILLVAVATAVTALLKQFAPQFTFGIYYAAVFAHELPFGNQGLSCEQIRKA